MPKQAMKKSSKTWQSILLCAVLILIICFFLFRDRFKSQDASLSPENTSYFFTLKINSFSSANIPLLEIAIENKPVLAKLDLGCGGALELSRDVLQSLKNKLFIKKNYFFGIRGRTYETDVYEIPRMSMGEIDIFPMRAQEENTLFKNDGVVFKTNSQIENAISGRLGWHVFEPFNLLLDCPQSKIFICDSLATLKKQGYPIDSFIGTPLLLDRGFIEFEASIESGSLRCVLDTGSTWNLLNQNFKNPEIKNLSIDLQNLKARPKNFNPENENLLVIDLDDLSHYEKFEIKGHDFGPISFTNMNSPVGLQAIIGMEFIEDHPIFIDFRNKMIFISN